MHGDKTPKGLWGPWNATMVSMHACMQRSSDAPSQNNVPLLQGRINFFFQLIDRASSSSSIARGQRLQELDDADRWANQSFKLPSITPNKFLGQFSQPSSCRAGWPVLDGQVQRPSRPYNAPSGAVSTSQPHDHHKWLDSDYRCGVCLSTYPPCWTEST